MCTNRPKLSSNWIGPSSFTQKNLGPLQQEAAQPNAQKAPTAFNLLCLVWVCLPTTRGPSALAMPLPITRQRKLFCLFFCRGTLTCYGVGALSIPHGMHLVVQTHLYFFWTVCHPSRTFPPKESEQEPQNRFSPLPTARPCPLTSDS